MKYDATLARKPWNTCIDCRASWHPSRVVGEYVFDRIASLSLETPESIPEFTIEFAKDTERHEPASNRKYFAKGTGTGWPARWIIRVSTAKAERQSNG